MAYIQNKKNNNKKQVKQTYKHNFRLSSKKSKEKLKTNTRLISKISCDTMMTKLNVTTKNYSHFWKTLDATNKAYHLWNMKISSILIQKLKPTFLISNLTPYLPPKETLSLSRLAKMRVQDLKTAGGLPSNTTWHNNKDARDRHLKKWST